MRSKALVVGLSLLLASLLLVGACGPSPQDTLMPAEPTCQCGEWGDPGGFPLGDVRVEFYMAGMTPSGELSPATGIATFKYCGETVTLSAPGTVTLSSVMNCVPEGCGEAVITHYVINPGGAYTIEDFGNSVELTYGPPYGVYTVVLNATCNGEPCTPCKIFVDFEDPSETGTWTGCGIINEVTTSPANWTLGWTGTGIIPETVITFQECNGDAYTLYGDPALAAGNSSAILSNYSDCQCAQYCWIEEDGKKGITQWTTVSIDDPCCDDCCQLCCEVDFSFIGSPFGGGGGLPGGPPSLCPGQILIYQYNLTNNSPYEIDYDFSNSTPAFQIDFSPGAGTVDANGGEQIITVYYQMPGNLNETCNQSSCTFTHDLNITIDPDGDAVECTPIEGSVLINCHNCPGCEPKMHYQQYPDEDGWDVSSCKFASGDDIDHIIQVADDWQCTESGLISHIRFWGSWKEGYVGLISGFNVEIYSNSLEGGYSHPDAMLWDSFVPYSFGAVELAIYEGWYNPWTDLHDEQNNNTYYRYDITDIREPFYQKEGNIYWLSIWPEIEGDAVWGWKSSEDHWMDDACYSVHLPQTPAVDWHEIYEPNTPVPQSLDLAFVICGGELPCQCGEWHQAQVKWTNENGQPTGEFLDCQTAMGLTSILGETITVHPSITCSSSCEQHIPTAVWQVIKDSTGNAIESGSGLEAHFVPDETGSYTIKFYNVTCDGVDCEDCTIFLKVIVTRPR